MFVIESHAEREKGRGAKANWKNNTEDIWFCTLGNNYTFNVDAVKIKRKVVAPYQNTKDGRPKDWEESIDGNYRLTYPSNLLVGYHDTFLVNAGRNTDHPTSEIREVDSEVGSSQLSSRRLCFRSFSWKRYDCRRCEEARASLLRHRAEPGILLLVTHSVLQWLGTDSSIQGYSDAWLLGEK